MVDTSDHLVVSSENLPEGISLSIKVANIFSDSELTMCLSNSDDDTRNEPMIYFNFSNEDEEAFEAYGYMDGSRRLQASLALDLNLMSNSMKDLVRKSSSVLFSFGFHDIFLLAQMGDGAVLHTSDDDLRNDILDTVFTMHALHFSGN